MSLSSYNGQSNFTIKGKKFIKRGADNIYDIASVAGTSGNFSTGWVQTDGTTTVANGAKMQFDHNLGTSDILVEVWAADDINGTNNNRLSYNGHDTGATIRYGAAVHGATNNTIGVVLGTYGYIDEQGDLSQAPTGVHQFTGKYIKVVASAGGGMARASGMIIRRYNNNNYWDLMHGVNVASMSQVYESGSGRYGYLNVVYTITLETPLANPIPIVSCSQFGSFTVQGYTNTTVNHKQEVMMYDSSSATTTNPGSATVNTNTNTAYENQEFDTLFIEQAYTLPAFTSFMIL